MNDFAEELLDSWIALSLAIQGSRIVNAFSLNEALILRYLYRNKDKEIIATDLCALLKMQKSQMNRTLISLEEKEMIERIRSKSDARQINIRIREDHEEEYLKEHEHVMSIVEHFINELGDQKAKEVKDVFFLISKLAKGESK